MVWSVIYVIITLAFMIAMVTLTAVIVNSILKIKKEVEVLNSKISRQQYDFRNYQNFQNSQAPQVQQNFPNPQNPQMN